MWYLVLGLRVSSILNTGTGLLVSFASATSSMHALHTSDQQHDGDNHSWMQAAAHTHTHTHCPRWVQEWLLCGLEMWTQPTTRWPQQLPGSQARHSILHSDPSSCVHCILRQSQLPAARRDVYRPRDRAPLLRWNVHTREERSNGHRDELQPKKDKEYQYKRQAPQNVSK